MDGLFNKAAQFAQDYASKQGNDNQNQNQNQNQQFSQQGQGQQGGMPGGFGGMAQQFLGGQGGQGQQQYGGQGQGQQQQYGNQQGGGAADEFFNKTGGAEFNAPHGSGGASGGGGGGFNLPNFNNNAALSEAQQNSGSHGDSDMFSSALGFISKFGKDDQDVDEEKVVQQHEKVYQQGQGGQMDASSIGSAAALQAMKNFMSGGGQQQQQQESGGLNKIIGLALSEAARMFDKSGGAASGTKQDAVNSAGATMMKLLIKSKFSGTQTTGGADSGGLGQLMGLASKFL